MTLTSPTVVEHRDGHYVAVTPGAPAAVVAARAGIRQTIDGRVTDVDRDEIRVKTDKDSFEIRLPNANTSGIRKGDMVQLDVTINPAAPTAS